MSYDDTVKEFTALYQNDRDTVARVKTEKGRSVLLLLSRVDIEYGLGEWAGELSYYEVTGHRLESGKALPDKRLGEDTRDYSITQVIMLEGMEEYVPCYLYSAGGDYGIDKWSMYIPLQQWSCDYLAHRWCPNNSDMSTYIEVRDLGAGYTNEAFFASYEKQFGEGYYWTNESYLADGEANVAWARGYQKTGAGRYYESFLFAGEGYSYEVLWTYAADTDVMEGWAARMRYTAETFCVIGDERSYAFGALWTPGDEPNTETVEYGNLFRQETSASDIEAGTYLVLPEENFAMRLERFLGGEMAGDVIFTQIYGYYEPGNALYVVIYCAESGGEVQYLAVEHNGRRVTRSLVMSEEEALSYGDNKLLGGAVRGKFARGEAEEQNLHPAIFYDAVNNELTSHGSRPMQPAQG